MKKPSWTVWGTIVLVAVLAGMLSGVSAAVFTNTSLDRYLESLGEGSGFLSISQVKPDPIPGTYEEALEVVQESAWTSTALVVLNDVEVLDATDRIGTGMVVTSDGWILLDTGTFDGVGDPLTDVGVWIHDTTFPIESIVDDPRSGLSLVKLIGVANMDTVAFGNSEDFLGGEILFGIPDPWSIVPNSLRDASARGALVSEPAEDFLFHWEMTHTFEASMPVFDTLGELVGFSNASGEVTPFAHIAPFISSVLRDGETAYAGIGLYTMELAEGLTPVLGPGSERGFYVAPPASRRSGVLSGGPADLAGIEDGDILTALGGISLTDGTSIAGVLAEHTAGETTTLEFVRDRERFTVELTFVPLEDLLY